jgi:hypothetical protein
LVSYDAGSSARMERATRRQFTDEQLQALLACGNRTQRLRLVRTPDGRRRGGRTRANRRRPWRRKKKNEGELARLGLQGRVFYGGELGAWEPSRRGQGRRGASDQVSYEEESDRRVSIKILGLMGCFSVRGKGVCGWAALSLPQNIF